MPSVNFYELSSGSISRITCQLLEKAYSKNYKTLVVTKDVETEAIIDKELWTFSQKSFIPHGSNLDDKAEEQPIYITSTHTNKNNADTLFLVGSTDYIFESYERIYVIFEASDITTSSSAKICYQKLNNPNNTLAYYTQDLKGAWQTKTFT